MGNRVVGNVVLTPKAVSYIFCKIARIYLIACDEVKRFYLTPLTPLLKGVRADVNPSLIKGKGVRKD